MFTDTKEWTTSLLVALGIIISVLALVIGFLLVPKVMVGLLVLGGLTVLIHLFRYLGTV